MSLLPQNREHGWAPYVWLVFLSFFFFKPVLDPHTTGRDWLVALSATVVFLVIYFTVFWVGRSWNYFLIGCMAVMGLGLARINEGSSVFIIFTASFISWAFPNPKWALTAIGSLIAILGLDALLFPAPLHLLSPSMVESLRLGTSNLCFS